MNSAAILAKLQAQRQLVIEIEAAADGKPAKVVTARRPPMGEWEKFVEIDAQGRRALSASWELSASYVIGWSGFTEGGLLGSEQAPDDAVVEFDQALWMFIAADHMEWCRKIGDKLIDAIVNENAKRKADAGN